MIEAEDKKQVVTFPDGVEVTKTKKRFCHLAKPLLVLIVLLSFQSSRNDEIYL